MPNNEEVVINTPNPSLLENAQLEDDASRSHLLSSSQSYPTPHIKRPSLNYKGLSNLDGIEWPADVLEYNVHFARCLERIKRRHDSVVTNIAQGIIEYKHALGIRTHQADLQLFLDRFYLSRIGIRMLIGQHIALCRSDMNQARGRLSLLKSRPNAAQLSDVSGREPEDYVGVICTNTNVGSVAHEAIENARYVCEEHYGLFRAPPVQLVCPKDLKFMYVPSHLNHMLFELLKNSLRAVVERFGADNEDRFPTTKVIVVEGKEDITIKISDEGGGIPRSEVPLVWTYMYTTAVSEEIDPTYSSSEFQAPMAGFGYGLPLARLVRYLGLRPLT